jgi:ABC-type polysaccharide/polyol phosphate transport system ATPase subunit
MKNSDSENSINYSVDIYNVSKSFARQSRSGNYSTIKSALLGLCGYAHDEAPKTHAIKDLTMRIPRGSSVGVIGRNGSGKSTLLKLITGIYRPDTGHVKVNGSIAALIELGAGFHPDFTGRENLYLAGVLHGLTRAEITARLPEIVEFAELQDFIDAPVRTYSSGMFMRLGFSLAIHTNPDVLLVDEVLAVGDARFVVKCKEKVSELRRQKKTLFLVSHDLDAVERWCDEVIWIHKGVVMDRGEPRRVIDHYRTFNENEEESDLQAQTEVATEISIPADLNQVNEHESYERWGSREVEITEIKLTDQSGAEKHVFHSDDALNISIKYVTNDQYKDPVFGFAINRADGLAVIGTNTQIEKVGLALNKEGLVQIRIPKITLLDHTYFLDVAVHREDGYPYDYHKRVVKFSVRSDLNIIGVYNPGHTWSIT